MSERITLGETIQSCIDLAKMAVSECVAAADRWLADYGDE